MRKQQRQVPGCFRAAGRRADCSRKYGCDCTDAWLFWEIAHDNPNIIGDFVWAGIDYIGETGIGATEYRDYLLTEDESHMTGGNGRIDLLGKPRAEAAYTRVALEREMGPLIGVLPVYEDEKLQLTGWQLSKAVESWFWRGCAGRTAYVEVYARAAEVELFVNGKSFGRKKRAVNGCMYRFKAVYEDGEITAVFYNENGVEIGRYSLKTAGEESTLRVTPEGERFFHVLQCTGEPPAECNPVGCQIEFHGYPDRLSAER